MNPHRVAFVIDGFNLYHSLKNASNDLGLGGSGTRWLNLRAFCQSYLHAIGNAAQLSDVCYFSAFATHLQTSDPSVIRRHKRYIECLEDTGVIVEMGRFKDKMVRCTFCGKTMTRHEEKETDVAISIKIMELCVQDQCDTVAVVTGDTDIAPAIRMAKRLYGHKQMCVLFPYGRHNSELKILADKSFKIQKNHYIRHQFSDPYILKNGYNIAKPSRW